MHQADSIHIGYVNYPAGGQVGPCIQSGLLLVYVYEGCIDLWVNRKPRHLDAGEIALLHPGHHVVMQFSRLGSTRHGWCRFDHPSRDNPENALPPGIPFSKPFNRRMRRLARAARAARVYSGAAKDPYFFAMAHGLLSAFLGPPQENIPKALHRADAFLQARYTGDITLSDMAVKAGVTPGHLIRLYRRHLGVTPVRRLWNLRVASALELLRETGWPVQDIAAKTGFRNAHHFSRVIRESTGHAPLAYRNRAWVNR